MQWLHDAHKLQLCCDHFAFLNSERSENSFQKGLRERMVEKLKAKIFHSYFSQVSHQKKKNIVQLRDKLKAQFMNLSDVRTAMFLHVWNVVFQRGNWWNEVIS
jgi:hypothetical protein